MGVSVSVNNILYVNHEGITCIRVKPEYLHLKDVLMNMSYGKERREQILSTLKTGIHFGVNGMHQIQTKNDPDIKYLIKKNKIELITKHESTRFKRSYIVYKE